MPILPQNLLGLDKIVFFMEPIMRTVNPDDWSSLQYFERVLISSGIIAKLEEMGAKEGVTVSINGFEFDYVD